MSISSQNPINNRLTGQAVGSAGSMGANCREANNSLGKKDFLHNRMKIARKESKEVIHWLILLREANNVDYCEEIIACLNEAQELKNIFSAIISKCG